jgi:hypothetical protein
MKRLLFFCLVLNSLNVTAQEAVPYEQLLAGTKEISFTDSLNLDAEQESLTAIDSITVKKYFPQILSNGANKFKNKSYSVFGKITSNDKFDLLLVQEEKKKNDTVTTRVTYLISLRKNGDYITSLKAAVKGSKKRSDYNISSWLYKDNKIFLDSKIMTNDQLYSDMTWYKINAGGRFIIYPNN